jgi:predicted metal-binding protein
MKVSLCQSCALGRNGFGAILAAALAEAGISAQVSTVDCLSGCTRASALAFRAQGKTAYLFGDLTPSDLQDLVTFARAYQASPDGKFADARFLGDLRTKALARIPG